MRLGSWVAAIALALGQPSPPHGSTGCASVPRSLPDRPAGDAIAAVPNLSSLAREIDASGLAAELNGSPDVTVFAPANEAFTKVADPVTLDQAVLRYHVVPERIGPDRLIGTHRTLQGGELSVARGPGGVEVNAASGLICMRVQTANGNVYLIDTLLTPR